jgi:hypothetical protein
LLSPTDKNLRKPTRQFKELKILSLHPCLALFLVVTVIVTAAVTAVVTVVATPVVAVVVAVVVCAVGIQNTAGTGGPQTESASGPA